MNIKIIVSSPKSSLNREKWGEFISQVNDLVMKELTGSVINVTTRDKEIDWLEANNSLISIIHGHLERIQSLEDKIEMLEKEKEAIDDLKFVDGILQFFKDNNLSGECFEYVCENIKSLSDIVAEEMMKYSDMLEDGEYEL